MLQTSLSCRMRAEARHAAGLRRGKDLFFGTAARAVSALGAAMICVALANPVFAAPKVIVISLDGATPRFIQEFLRDGSLPQSTGLGLLTRVGTTAGR